MLAGGFNKKTKFPENDHRNYNINGDAFDIGDTFSGVDFLKGLNAVDKLKEILPNNYTMSQLALKWILMHKAVTVVIPGAVSPNQVESNCKVSDFENIDDKMDMIKKIYEDFIKKDVHHRWN